MIELRPYQQECIDTIAAQPPGRYLVQMATGLGKTVTFANLPRDGRMLILSHREELVRQPLKYFSCSTGVEMAKERSSGQEVVSASVASLTHRIDRFHPEEFQLIIVDEAHHAAAKSYKTVLNYFQPEKVIGFTATPNRGDGGRLDDVFQRIIYEKGLEEAIREGWLCEIYCLRVNIGYDLSAVHTRMGDYAPGELEQAMDGTADAIAQAYREYAEGATLIFAVSVEQCEEIAARIPGAVVVSAKTKNRAEIIQQFTRREIPCIVNCMVFTEGTDMPLIETVIVARPTKSDALYTQMVGRGLRKHPEKSRLKLIDCVGVSHDRDLCTAPSLLGINLGGLPKKSAEKLTELPLFDLPRRVQLLSDQPVSWIRNVEVVELFAKEGGYNLHGVEWFRQPDGSLTLHLKDDKLVIPPANKLGYVDIDGHQKRLQDVLDEKYQMLLTQYGNEMYLWDKKTIDRWRNQRPSERQVSEIQRFLGSGFDTGSLSKGDASKILTRLYAGTREEKRRWRMESAAI